MLAIYSPGSLKEISPINAKKVIDINLTGIINCLPTIVNAMKRKQKGMLFLCPHPAGYRGMPGAGLYGVTKSGLTF